MSIRKMAFILLALGFAAAPVAAGAGSAQTIKVVIVAGGLACPLARASDGATISLMGLPNEFRKPGTKLTLKGSFIESSPCQQGAGTFRIESSGVALQ